MRDISFGLIYDPIYRLMTTKAFSSRVNGLERMRWPWNSYTTVWMLWVLSPCPFFIYFMIWSEFDKGSRRSLFTHWSRILSTDVYRSTRLLWNRITSNRESARFHLYEGFEREATPQCTRVGESVVGFQCRWCCSLRDHTRSFRFCSCVEVVWLQTSRNLCNTSSSHITTRILTSCIVHCATCAAALARKFRDQLEHVDCRRKVLLNDNNHFVSSLPCPHSSALPTEVPLRPDN